MRCAGVIRSCVHFGVVMSNGSNRDKKTLDCKAEGTGLQDGTAMLDISDRSNRQTDLLSRQGIASRCDERKTWRGSSAQMSLETRCITWM